MWKTVLNDTGCPFGVIVLLQNTSVASHPPPWWYCHIKHSSLNLAKRSPLCFFLSAGSLLYRSPALWQESCFHSRSHISDCDPSVQSACCKFSATHILFSRIFYCLGHVSTLEAFWRVLWMVGECRLFRWFIPVLR